MPDPCSNHPDGQNNPHTYFWTPALGAVCKHCGEVFWCGLDAQLPDDGAPVADEPLNSWGV